MAIFKKNKKEETKKVSTQEDNELKDEISKAYDEIMSGNKEEKAEEQPQQAPKDDIARFLQVHSCFQLLKMKFLNRR